MSEDKIKYRRELRRIFAHSFSMSDVRVMSFDLGVNWDELRGETQQEKVQALIQHLGLRGRLQDLIDLAKEERENIEDWPVIPEAHQQIEDEKEELSEDERRVIFDGLMDKIRPLATSLLQIKSLVEENIPYLNDQQKVSLVKLLESADMANHINLGSISLFRADLSDANLKGANLNGANLRLAKLQRAVMYKADMPQAILTHADLHRANLVMADLRGADLENANLFMANLSFAMMRGANLRKADLKLATLNEADLRETDLRGAILATAVLDGVNLKGAKYDKKTSWPEGFSPSDHGAVFQG